MIVAPKNQPTVPTRDRPISTTSSKPKAYLIPHLFPRKRAIALMPLDSTSAPNRMIMTSRSTQVASAAPTIASTIATLLMKGPIGATIEVWSANRINTYAPEWLRDRVRFGV